MCVVLLVAGQSLPLRHRCGRLPCRLWRCSDASFKSITHRLLTSARTRVQEAMTHASSMSHLAHECRGCALRSAVRCSAAVACGSPCSLLAWSQCVLACCSAQLLFSSCHAAQVHPTCSWSPCRYGCGACCGGCWPQLASAFGPSSRCACARPHCLHARETHAQPSSDPIRGAVLAGAVHTGTVLASAGHAGPAALHSASCSCPPRQEASRS